MSALKLLKLKKVIENNSDIGNKTNLELVVWATILEDDEIPIKNFKARMVDMVSIVVHVPPDTDLIEGELLITNKRIIFISGDETGGELIYFYYNEMDDFFKGSNQNDPEDGIFVVEVGGYYSIFSGFMRFGMSKWEDYVLEKIEESYE